MDNVFTPDLLNEPTFLQRLLKKPIKENAIIEVNNLLASKPLREINGDEIVEIANHYQVDLQAMFPEQLRALYERFLNKCFEDNALTDEEFSDLNYLRNLLLLNEGDVSDMYNALAINVYKSNYDETLGDGPITAEKEAFLNKLKQSLYLPDDLVKKINADSTNTFLESQLNKIAEDERVSPEEMNEFNKLAASLGVNTLRFQASKDKIERFKLYWRIENAELPVIDAGLSLQTNEQCYFSAPGAWYELTTVTKAIKYSVRSTTFKYSSGLHTTSGTRTSERITADEMKMIDEGNVYLTNKRLLFVGAKKNSTILLNKVLSIKRYEDGVEFEKDSGKSPVICVREKGDIFGLMVTRVLGDLEKKD